MVAPVGTADSAITPAATRPPAGASHLRCEYLVIYVLLIGNQPPHGATRYYAGACSRLTEGARLATPPPDSVLSDPQRARESLLATALGGDHLNRVSPGLAGRGHGPRVLAAAELPEVAG